MTDHRWLRNVHAMSRFMAEREAVRIRKDIIESGGRRRLGLTPVEKTAWGSGGWAGDLLTCDPVLRRFRFCNVRREDDRVTRWVRENIREPYADHEHLWLMLAIARTINWPETLECLINNADDNQAWPSSPDFSPARMGEVMQEYKNLGHKLYTGAYMIRAESDPAKPWYDWSKQRYIAEVVIGRLWEDRESWVRFFSYEPRQKRPAPDLYQTWERFQPYVGWGPFMAYQVVVDLRHTRYLRAAPDIGIWAALGPGSRRGLNRLAERPVGASLSQEEGLAEMRAVSEALHAPGSSWVDCPWRGEPLELSDVQNCLCEWDKYQRVMNGEGRPRALYVPGRGW